MAARGLISPYTVGFGFFLIPTAIWYVYGYKSEEDRAKELVSGHSSHTPLPYTALTPLLPVRSPSSCAVCTVPLVRRRRATTRRRVKRAQLLAAVAVR